MEKEIRMFQMCSSRGGERRGTLMFSLEDGGSLESLHTYKLLSCSWPNDSFPHEASLSVWDWAAMDEVG